MSTGRPSRKPIPRDRAALPKVSRDAVLAVRCPRCTALPGADCRNGNGQVLTGGHQLRRVAAERAAYRQGKRPGAPTGRPRPLTAEEQARRDSYRVEQQKRAQTSAPRPDTRAAGHDPRGRRVIPAADAVRRDGRHQLRVDDGISRPPAQTTKQLRVTPEPPVRAPARAVPPPPVAPAAPVRRRRSGLAKKLPAPDPRWADARLPIEMIPAPLWGVSGNKVLAQADWDKVRQRVYALAGHRCEICGGVGRAHSVEAAERWEYDDDYLVQTLVGVTALCPTCHLATTPGRAGWLASTQPGSYSGLPEQVRQHLAAVNGWDLDTTDACIAWAVTVNTLRSSYPGWTSDWTSTRRLVALLVGPERDAPQRCRDTRAAISGSRRMPAPVEARLRA
jgi:hypothetical protein